MDLNSGLGTWQLRKQQCVRAVREALEIGYRHIDTASAYENESEVGEGAKGFPRADLFITTKLWIDVQKTKDVEASCDASLKKLSTDYVDLYLLHWPKQDTFLDLLHAMHRLREKGKVRRVGICNATIGHLKKALSQKIEISMNQVEFHPFLYQKELLEFCHKHNIGLTAYCPLAQGEVRKNKTLKEIGKRQGKTAAQVTLRWLLQKKIVPIPKASSEDHLRENFEISDFKLSTAEMSNIDALNENRRLVAPDWNEFAHLPS